jgi:hypothetical protein
VLDIIGNVFASDEARSELIEQSLDGELVTEKLRAAVLEIMDKKVDI